MSNSILGLGRRLLEFFNPERKVEQPSSDTIRHDVHMETKLEHKNLELLRFYISRDINRLDKKIQQSESNMLGYFLGSLVDALIVILFGDSFDAVAAWFAEEILCLCDKYITLTIVVFKIFCIILLIGLFCLVAWITRKASDHLKSRAKESGKAEYQLDEERQETIDKFDNIACDGLLICENYTLRYTETDKPYVRDFYLYEIIHHLSKAALIFDLIYQNKDRYVSSENAELLDTYRLNNFMDFFREIVVFIQGTIPNDSGDKDLIKDIDNLVEYTTKWKSL